MIITYSTPSNSPKRFESDSNLIILGRNPLPDQHIDLDLVSDEYVSHVHARLTYENNEYWIEDLNSINGTWVDGKKITGKTRVIPGSKVKVGWTIIEVHREPALPMPEQGPAPGPEATIFEVQDAAKPPPVAEQDPSADLEVTIYNADEMTKLGPVPEKDTAPDSEGAIQNVTDATKLPFRDASKVASDEDSTQAWRQLRAFYDFSQALGTATALESLMQTLVKQLQLAIPGAQRGAVLLPDERGELLLKAHWPSGDHSVSVTLVKRAFAKREAFIWAAPASTDNTGGDVTPHSALYYKVQSAIYVPLLLAGDVLGVMYVDNYYIRDAFSSTDLELLRAFANQMAMYVRDHVLRQDLQREEVLRSNLLRQFSPKVAERMLEECKRLRLGGERVDPVTILVSDVRSFTAVSAKMQPDDVVRMLNEMFNSFVPIIIENDGVVDKYVGDSVLAVFGSPQQDDRQWEKAVRVAVEMQEAIHKLQEGWKVRRLPVLQVGISIHTGEVIHGFIGSSERMEYTVIGDTVNRASRYCDGAGPGEVVISRAVYEHVYHLVDVSTKTIRTKHPDTEPDLEAYVVKGLKENDPDIGRGTS